MDTENIEHGQWWRGAVSAVVFHFVRKFPNWATWLPTHTVILKKIESPAADVDAVPDADTDALDESTRR